MAQPVLTVGEIALVDVRVAREQLGTRITQKRWRIKAKPHVQIRMKAMFEAILKNKVNHMELAHTDANCRDLQWFMLRYPLEISEADRKALRSSARREERRQERVVQILRGDFQLPVSGMVLPPRPYQEQAAAMVLENRGLLLVDDLGLGKTVSAICVMADARALPTLCVVPAPLTFQWRDQIHKFMPSLRVHIVTQSKIYDLRDAEGEEPHVIIIAYTRLARWADHLMGNIRLLVLDEVQELRTGHQAETTYQKISQKNLAAKQLAMQATYRLGLTATPIYNYGGELWNLMDVLAPGVLADQSSFLREWCTGAGRKAEVREPHALGSYLRESGAMLRRTRNDVGRELPPVSTVIHEITQDISDAFLDSKSAAAELARIVLDDATKVLDRGQAGRRLNIMLRQATGVGKAPEVAAFVRMLIHQQNEKVVLFGWHRIVYDIWAQLLSDLGVVWYTGTESVPTKRAEVKAFLEGDAKVLLMSLRAGMGLDGLQEVCATAVFGELDWAHGVHEQCVGRLHRDGQTRPVFAYYPIADSGSDPIVVDVLGLKASQLHGIRDPEGSPLTSHKAEAGHIKKLAQAYLQQIAKPTP